MSLNMLLPLAPSPRPRRSPSPACSSQFPATNALNLYAPRITPATTRAKPRDNSIVTTSTASSNPETTRSPPHLEATNTAGPWTISCPLSKLGAKYGALKESADVPSVPEELSSSPSPSPATSSGAGSNSPSPRSASPESAAHPLGAEHHEQSTTISFLSLSDEERSDSTLQSGFFDPEPNLDNQQTANSSSDQVYEEPASLASVSLSSHETATRTATEPSAPSAEPLLSFESSQKSSTPTGWGGARLFRLYSSLTSTFSRNRNANQNPPPEAKSTPLTNPFEDNEDGLISPLFSNTVNLASESTEKSPDPHWTRTSSIGSIHGLLASAFDYLVAVAPSRSASISGRLPPTAESSNSDNPPSSPNLPSPDPTAFVNKNEEDAKSIKSIDSNINETIPAFNLPSPSKSRSSVPTSRAPPSNTPSAIPLATSPSLSFSIPARFHAAYQAIVSSSSSTQQPQLPIPQNPKLQADPPTSRKEALEAVLHGQQSALKVRRSNSTTHPAMQSGRDAVRREKYMDYYRDTASPPPLPIPSSSISRATSPVASTSTSAPSRRNTLDSTTASFSSFYSSNTTVPGPPPSSSNSRERERESHHRSRERVARVDRALSPDPYLTNSKHAAVSQGLPTSPSVADPFAAARLEDRCRQLEKVAKDFQSKLRVRDQEIKIRDSELRSREAELRGKDMELRDKEREVRERETELRGSYGELRKREIELRDKDEELKEAEGLLREMEGEVRWRDVELERFKSREREWVKELKKARQNGDSRVAVLTDIAGRKSMKELVDRTNENLDNLRNELKRRASLSPVLAAGEQCARHMSLNPNGRNLDSKLSTSAPSGAYLTNGYVASKRQEGEATSSGLGSSEASGSKPPTRMGNLMQLSVPSAPQQSQQRPEGLAQQSQPHQLTIPIPLPAPQPAAPPTLLYTEAQAQQRIADDFLTRTDSWSGAQVLQAVNDINSEVVQFAAAVTEMCKFAPREVPSPSPSPSPLPSSDSPSGLKKPNGANDAGGNPLKATKAYSDTATRLGASLTHLLATYDHSNDPILVQLALQACVCVAAKRAWESFCLGLPAKSDGVLGVIYRSLRELEPQPTSSKWRSLTHGHIHAIYPTLAAYSSNELAETMLRWTVDILTLAGCAGIESTSGSGVPTASSPTSDSLENYDLNPPTIALRTQHTTSLLLPQLLHITTALTRLENVLRQDILSTSFDLVIPECGMAFGKGWMVDFFGYTSGSSSASPPPTASGARYEGEATKVMGSVEVGLMCRTKMGMRGGGTTPTATTPTGRNGSPSGGSSILGGQGTNMSQQQGGGGGTGAVYEERLLLMPKVILESVVELL